MAMRKADIGEFFAELVRFTILTGFFWWLLENGPHFAMDIVNSLRDALCHLLLGGAAICRDHDTGAGPGHQPHLLARCVSADRLCPILNHTIMIESEIFGRRSHVVDARHG